MSTLIRTVQDISLDEVTGIPTVTLNKVIRDTGVVLTPEVARRLPQLVQRFLTGNEQAVIIRLLKGERPVEISRALKIAQCEVVRMRQLATRKLVLLVHFEILHNRRQFIKDVLSKVKTLNKKQRLIFALTYSYFPLADISWMAMQQPGNLIRTRAMIKRHLTDAINASPLEPPFDPYFINALDDLRYLRFVPDTPPEL